MEKYFEYLRYVSLLLMINSSSLSAQVLSGDGVNPLVGINQNNQGIVKKSRTSICHAPGSTFYDRTDNFVAYKTIDECLKSGGRLPKR